MSLFIWEKFGPSVLHFPEGDFLKHIAVAIQSLNHPRAAAGRGDAAVGGRRRGRWPVGACRAPRPPPPFQVPSASRRGGLKTPGGGCRPSALGSGRSGPRGGVVGRSLPSPRRLRRPPRGRGGARRGAPRSLPVLYFMCWF